MIAVDTAAVQLPDLIATIWDDAGDPTTLWHLCLSCRRNLLLLTEQTEPGRKPDVGTAQKVLLIFQMEQPVPTTGGGVSSRLNTTW